MGKNEKDVSHLAKSKFSGSTVSNSRMDPFWQAKLGAHHSTTALIVLLAVSVIQYPSTPATQSHSRFGNMINSKKFTPSMTADRLFC